MDKDRFFETLKYLIYLFETNRKTNYDKLLAKQEKTREMVRELLEEVFNIKYVVAPKNLILTFLNYDRDIHRVMNLNGMFKKLEMVRDGLPEKDRFDVQGLLNDISKDISMFNGLSIPEPRKKDINDLLGKGNLEIGEATRIISFHCNRLGEVERDEKGSAVAQNSFETTKQALLPFVSKESVEELFRRFDADGTES